MVAQSSCCCCCLEVLRWLPAFLWGAAVIAAMTLAAGGVAAPADLAKTHLALNAVGVVFLLGAWTLDRAFAMGRARAERPERRARRYEPLTDSDDFYFGSDPVRADPSSSDSPQ